MPRTAMALNDPTAAAANETGSQTVSSSASTRTHPLIPADADAPVNSLPESANLRRCAPSQIVC
jgi:hypothetical protein